MVWPVMSKKPPPYPLQPDDDTSAGSAQPRPPQHGPRVDPAPGVEPVPLETADERPAEMEPPVGPPSAEAEAAESSVKALDVCPNCGAGMRTSGTLVCMRCGFDLKSLRVIETVTGESTEVAPDDESPPVRAPISPGDPDELWLPAGIGGLGIVVLGVGYLAGAAGLFGAGDEALATIGAADRLWGLLRFVLLAAMLTACGLGGLYVVARLLETTIGDLKLAALRMAAAVLTARLCTFLRFDGRTVEWVVETAGQAAIFLAVSMLLFRMNRRNTLILGVATAIIFAVMWLGAWIVTRIA